MSTLINTVIHVRIAMDHLQFLVNYTFGILSCQRHFIFFWTKQHVMKIVQMSEAVAELKFGCEDDHSYFKIASIDSIKTQGQLLCIICIDLCFLLG